VNQTPDCLMTVAETNMLVELARDRWVLQLGAWKGETTLRLADVARLVVDVDHFRGDAYTGPADTLPEYRANLARSCVADDVVTVVASFGMVWDVLARRCYGLVVVDGAHDLQSVRHDLELAVVMCKPDGHIAVHDWGRWDVERACTGLLGTPDSFVESLAIYSGLP